jgi:hypothetical protein
MNLLATIDLSCELPYIVAISFEYIVLPSVGFVYTTFPTASLLSISHISMHRLEYKKKRRWYLNIR